MTDTSLTYQFELQASRLHFKIVRKLRDGRYILFDEKTGDEVNAIVVHEAFDFYRLHLAPSRIQLLLCQRFNAVLPVRCVCIEESHVYEPGSTPLQLRKGKRRRSADESHVLISQLLCGSKSTVHELEAMTPRTRQRYLSKRDRYLRPKRGRPVAS